MSVGQSYLARHKMRTLICVKRVIAQLHNCVSNNRNFLILWLRVTRASFLHRIIANKKHPFPHSSYRWNKAKPAAAYGRCFASHTAADAHDIISRDAVSSSTTAVYNESCLVTPTCKSSMWEGRVSVRLSHSVSIFGSGHAFVTVCGDLFDPLHIFPLQDTTFIC